MNGGAVARGVVGAEAHPTKERDRHMVRIVMREAFLGGCELEVKLTAEEAANFASTIYALAKQAMVQNDRHVTTATSAAA